jgi:hypothetical protein
MSMYTPASTSCAAHLNNVFDLYHVLDDHRQPQNAEAFLEHAKDTLQTKCLWYIKCYSTKSATKSIPPKVHSI